MDETDAYDADIPPLLPPDQWPPLRTQADLHRQWRALMGPLGFGSRRLWLLFLDREQRATELLVQIDDPPEDVEDGTADGLLAMCSHVLVEHDLGRVAVLLSRPGPAALTESDRQWGRALLAAARRAHVPLAPVHLANDEVLVPLTGDDLVTPRSVMGR